MTFTSGRVHLGEEEEEDPRVAHALFHPFQRDVLLPHVQPVCEAELGEGEEESADGPRAVGLRVGHEAGVGHLERVWLGGVGGEQPVLQQLRHRRALVRVPLERPAQHVLGVADQLFRDPFLVLEATISLAS